MPTRHRSGRTCRGVFAGLLALAAFVLLLDAGYVHAKAALAQVLLERAWTQTRLKGEAVKPWPWADVAAVAHLAVPRLGIGQIVLAGDSGRALAFAPGWSAASAPPATAGVSVISAHRDTHFRFLADAVIGDVIIVQSASATRRYRVDSLVIADSRREQLALDADDDALVLVTCYPFDALDARGSLRYVVHARSEGGAPDGRRKPR